MNASRFCRDCRLAQTAYSYSLWTCRRLTGPSLVTGEYERRMLSCDAERADVELCGPTGARLILARRSSTLRRTNNPTRNQPGKAHV